MGAKLADTKTAFITYSWDSESHKDWVRALAKRLVENGVHVHLDQWDVQFGDSLTHFMDKCLPEADFVLVVCTPPYAVKSTGRLGGVGYEAQIITASIAAGIPRNKFIPIVRDGSLTPGQSDCAIPPHFFGVYALDARTHLNEDAFFENLLRHIYGQPVLQRPTLGPQPNFSVKNQSAPETETARLANIAVEKWDLVSGVVKNELHPETFSIPTEASRRTLDHGDFVKLYFNYAHPENEEEQFAGERMWVEVTSSIGPYYVGKLSNQPACTSDWHDLDYGSSIVFLPEHVISVDKGGKDAEEARKNDLEFTDIIATVFSNFGISDGDEDEVKVLLRILENERRFHPGADLDMLWDDVSTRVEYLPGSKDAARAMWFAMLAEDEEDQSVPPEMGAT